MLAGALGILQVVLSLRDRATKGGSHHAMSVLTAVNTIQLTQEVGLYSPETVAGIQEHYQSPHMGPGQHVEELLYVVLSGWAKRPENLKKEYFSTFKTVWGEKHTILAPVVKFENDQISPKWQTGPVPHCAATREEWM